MIQTIITLLSHMIIFAVAILPLIMAAFYKRLNLGYKYDFQSVLRIVPISVVLIIVSAYKIEYIAIFDHMDSPVLNTNVLLFFAIAFIVCLFLSIYFIVDRGIMHFKPKQKKRLLNGAAGVTILLSIFTIFSLVSESQENRLNYLDLAINMMYPTLTGVLSAAGVISLIFYKKTSISQRIYSLIFISSIPLIILDLVFAQQKHFMLTCIPYAVFLIRVFLEVFSSATTEQKTNSIDNNSFIDQFDLTEREMEVYTLAAQGKSNQDISEELFVSVHTVKSHMQHIYSKLNISNRYQLINFDKENKGKS